MEAVFQPLRQPHRFAIAKCWRDRSASASVSGAPCSGVLNSVPACLGKRSNCHTAWRPLTLRHCSFTTEMIRSPALRAALRWRGLGPTLACTRPMAPAIAAYFATARSSSSASIASRGWLNSGVRASQTGNRQQCTDHTLEVPAMPQWRFLLTLDCRYAADHARRRAADFFAH